MIDGPYGGCSIDIEKYERVVLVANGSGITFTLNILDDLVGRCVRLQRRAHAASQGSAVHLELRMHALVRCAAGRTRSTSEM